LTIDTVYLKKKSSNSNFQIFKILLIIYTVYLKIKKIEF